MTGITLSFREGVSLVEPPRGDGVALEWPRGRVLLPALSPGLLTALRALAAGGATEVELGGPVLAADGLVARGLLHYLLRWCDDSGLLRYTLIADGRPLAIVVPLAPGFRLPTGPLGRDTRVRLSRFAYCRRDEDALVIESPLSLARTVLPGRAGATLVAALARPRTVAEVSAAGELDVETAQAFVGLLAGTGVIAEVGEDGRLREDADPTLAQWEFHDLLFHSRSRLGRHDQPFGGTFPFLGKIPPLPAVKAPMSGDGIALHVPDLERLEREDPSLTRVLEGRRSVRDQGDPPIDARQLGEFLYRVARVRHVREPDPARSRHYQASSRPYPSGGAAYDLELYLTIDACAGLPPGIHHYDPVAHRLHPLVGRDAGVERLLRDAQAAAALARLPQVVITLASRFPRLSWKYRSIAYATTLKNVGVLYQTMYLVATAMGLAPCALGGGNAALFAQAVGTDYFAESSVGEFILGSCGAGPADRDER